MESKDYNLILDVANFLSMALGRFPPLEEAYYLNLSLFQGLEKIEYLF
jgi:hypothetical protein